MAQSTNIDSKKRPRERERSHKPRKSRKLSEDVSAAPEDLSSRDTSPAPTNKHSKKERKQNRSTRIHSLRKLLARETLPSNVQQEKERELAALMHEQDKVKSQKASKRILEKYHYVRFVERQKAEKRLRQLRKQMDMKEGDEDLSSKVHEMEVTRNYATYAPLDQKYISIFAPKPGNGKVTQKAVSTSDETSRPPLWYAVEAAMREGQQKLEALRDGKSKSARQIDADEEELLGQARKQSEPKPTPIIPKRESSIGGKHSKHIGHNQNKGSASHKEDEEMSDGGFFEK